MLDPRDPAARAADRLIAIELATKAARAELEHLTADDRRLALDAVAQNLTGARARELHDPGPEPTR